MKNGFDALVGLGRMAGAVELTPPYAGFEKTWILPTKLNVYHIRDLAGMRSDAHYFSSCVGARAAGYFLKFSRTVVHGKAGPNRTRPAGYVYAATLLFVSGPSCLG